MSYMDDVNNYDKVCADEAMRVLKKLLPYSVGSIENKQTHNYKNGYTDSLTGYDTDQYKTANFIFFADSHSDFILADESSTFILNHKHPENKFFDLKINADFTRYATLEKSLISYAGF